MKLDTVDLVREYMFYHTHVSNVDFIQEATQENYGLLREEIRLLLGEYQLPRKVKFPTLKQHYVHLSTKTPGLIAYTKSEEHANADRQTIVKPGKYLAEYFPEIREDIRRDLATAFISGCVDATLYGFATTAEEIADVYRNGPHSCMAGSSKFGDAHPSTAYARHPIAIAYLRDKNDPEKYTARTVVNMEAKQWVRIYGDAERLSNWLVGQGYTSNMGCLSGCYLNLIWDTGDESVIMPYLDGVQSFDVVGDLIKITPGGEYAATSTDGIVSLERTRCECCGDTVNEDDSSYVESMEGRVCEVCFSDTFCYPYDGRYRGSEAYRQADCYEYNGEYYTQEGLAYHNLLLIEGEVHHLDDCVLDYLSEEYIVNSDSVISIEDNRGDTHYCHESDEDEVRGLLKEAGLLDDEEEEETGEETHLEEVA